MPGTVLQIVPRLPPTTSGVADYATLLAGRLAAEHQWETRFLLADGGSGPAEPVSGFRVDRPARCGAAELRSALEEIAGDTTPVLLHYVGYGYQKRGCPLWLVQGLEQWKRASAKRKLAVVFHELFATGPIWTSSFWLSRFQRHLAARLAQAADGCLTNMARYADDLGHYAPHHAGRIVVRPVFSNLGEPPAPPPLRERAPLLVIFGGGAWTREALRQHTELLDRLCAQLGCERIAAIGPRAGHRWTGRTAFEEMGVLPAPELSAILLQARAGYLSYYSGYLGKSGIFAAYCAHRLLPIFPEPNASEADGLRASTHYLTAAQLDARPSLDSQQGVADAAHAWYAGHSLGETARAVADALAAIASEPAPEPTQPIELAAESRAP